MAFDEPSNYALVVQGGGQKGSFAAGVLDQFMKYNFNPFSFYVGTSAGALNISPYVTGQSGFGLNFILNFTTKSRFFNLKQFIKRKQQMDLDWAFKAMMETKDCLQIEKGKQKLKSREALACLTDAESLEDAYYPIFTDNWYNVLRATCAIPILYQQQVEIDGKTWIDGAIAANTPVIKAYKNGYKRIVVIQTSPLENDNKQLNEKQILHSRKLLQESLEHIHCHHLYKKRRQQAKYFERRLEGIIDQRIKALTDSQSGTDSEQKEKQSWGTYLEDTLHLVSVHAKRFGFDPSNTKALELLVTLFDNQAIVDDFLDSPPEDSFIYRIAPKRRLKSKTLLSGRNDILEDYSHGKMCATEFLADYIPQVYS
ncbi:patatin family protein [Photobacterium sp. BZF1]|uniref:patatin-like phospholipase family protein n=1 Tax=Photobacterium sp. BZF1 TaxID=1904457 RepID=UPI001653D457|nr:patatin-like phospholipase family protein [Photobacterium sp. BZF1]MBC7004585.1 patatin family protein [Photobacterium sp. BZF1]